MGRRTARRINLGYRLGFLSLAVGGWLVTVGVGVLVLRSSGFSDFLGWAGIIFAFGLFVLIGLGEVLTSAQRVTLEEGLVRLDVAMGLHNRLSSAYAGVSDWPPPFEKGDDRLRWSWGRLLSPLLGGALFLSLAFWIPVHHIVESQQRAGGNPIVWERLEATLEVMKEEGIIEEEVVAQFEEKLNALKRDAGDRKFSQSSLEASEALYKEVAGGLAVLERNLIEAERQLEALASADAFSPSEGAAFLEGLRSTLGEGPIPLRKEELARYKVLSENDLTQAGIEKLRKKLAEGARKAGQCKAALGGSDELSGFEMMAANRSEGDSGGGTEGGGTAPLTQKEPPVSIQDGPAEDLVSAEDLDFGDIVESARIAPKVEKREVTFAPGGAVAAPGTGGEAVWKNELTPEEQKVLRQFF